MIGTYAMLSISPICELGLRLGKLARDAIFPVPDWSRKERPSRRVAEAFAPVQLREVLHSLRIEKGQRVMLHAGADAWEGIGWEPAQLIDFLLDSIGPSGTLLMPSHPRLTGRNGERLYDVQRSPSTVGLLSELFRRRPSTLRSCFPYSAVCAQGQDAEELLRDHSRSYAPHDENSPYARLAAAGGRVLMLGCPVFTMTLMHVAEDTMRDRMGIPGFYIEEKVTVRNRGRTSAMSIHRRAAWLWLYLARYRWLAGMQENRLLIQGQAGGSPCYSADASGVVSWMQKQVLSRASLYPHAGLNRFLRFSGTSLKRGIDE